MASPMWWKDTVSFTITRSCKNISKSKGAKVSSAEQINSFSKLQEVVEDMTAKKEQLGIDGVFACTSLKPGEDWRWQTHLANIPISYEWIRGEVDLTSDATREIAFSYHENFKNIFDLYLQNSTVDPKLLGTKQVMDSMAEFALGKAPWFKTATGLGTISKG